MGPPYTHLGPWTPPSDVPSCPHTLISHPRPPHCCPLVSPHTPLPPGTPPLVSLGMPPHSSQTQASPRVSPRVRPPSCPRSRGSPGLFWGDTGSAGGGGSGAIRAGGGGFRPSHPPKNAAAPPENGLVCAGETEARSSGAEPGERRGGRVCAPRLGTRGAPRAPPQEGGGGGHGGADTGGNGLERAVPILPPLRGGPQRRADMGTLQDTVSDTPAAGGGALGTRVPCAWRGGPVGLGVLRGSGGVRLGVWVGGGPHSTPCPQGLAVSHRGGVLGTGDPTAPPISSCLLHVSGGLLGIGEPHNPPLPASHPLHIWGGG